MMELNNSFSSSASTLGCDAYGHSLLPLIATGVLNSILISLIVTIFTLSFGFIIGATIANMSGKKSKMKSLTQRVIDVFLAFPGFLLAILLASIMPASKSSVIFALIATGWATHARFFHAVIESTLHQPHIEAARACGASRFHIFSRHIVPIISPQITIQFLFSISHVILGEASLSYLGLGGSIEGVSLGKLIAEGRQFLIEAPHLSIYPGLALFILLLSFHYYATTLRERQNRRVAKVHYA